MNTPLIGILTIGMLVGLVVLLSRRSGRSDAERDLTKAGQLVERKASDELTKAPADSGAILDWMRRGGRNS